MSPSRMGWTRHDGLSLSLSTFSGVREVATGSGGFFFIIVPLAQKDVTHLKMVLQLGMFL